MPTPADIFAIASNVRLLDRVSQHDRFDDVSVIAKLRKKCSADELAAAIELVKARRRGKRKFDRTDDMVADVSGMEQATARAVSEHKANRLAACGVGEIVDLCCGIGGDAIGFLDAVETQVTLVDRDPGRLEMAAENVGVYGGSGRVAGAEVADVTSMRLRERVFHLDPARRDAQGRRRHGYHDYEPGPDFIERLLRHCPDGMIKLGPGVDLHALPPGEVELISVGGSLVQAVLYTGRLAAQPRLATRISGDVAGPIGECEVVSFAGEAGRAVVPREVGGYVMTVDAAIERSGLLGAYADEVGLGELHTGLGILTGDEPIESAWVDLFKVEAVMPWRVERVKAWLVDHDAGQVEVKTRGGAVEPDRVQKGLSGAGGRRWTVFALRLGRKVVAIITSRCRGGAGSGGDEAARGESA